MSQARFRSLDGIDMVIEYDTFGDPADPALLLIMGYTAQMVQWEEGWCRMLADRGLFVIRFDNRDCGLSTKLDGVTVDVDAVIKAALLEEPVPSVPYTLREMAADAVSLLDHLGIDRAHLVGASMGGMIAQQMAISYPERTASLTSIMSQPGDPSVGQPTPEAAAALIAPAPTEREAYLDHSATWLIWQSRAHRSEARMRLNAARDFDRSCYPEGGPRQLAAIYASGSRESGLAALKTPTLVIHGLDDTLISPSGGERTAALVPGATLLLVDDMGHDLPEPLWPMLVDAIAEHARSAA